MNSLKKTLTWVILFSLAMSFMESAVVIYLRELYYKTGFDFPLKEMPAFIGKVEFFREAGTIIMLVGIGIIAGKTSLQRFAYFVLAFAVWDVFYYVFLYVCLGWPQSLVTWDILFLIPVPWVGPVWAPCLLCVLMIIGALHIILRTEFDAEFKVSRANWCILISGALVCIISFMWDYLQFTQHEWSIFSEEALFTEMKTYIPQKFNHPLFFAGFLLMVTSVTFSIVKSNLNNHKQP